MSTKSPANLKSEDEEWLELAKTFFANSALFFVAIGSSAFYVVDFISAPDKRAVLLGLRISIIPLALIFRIWLRTSQSKTSFLNKYAVTTGVFSLLMVTIASAADNATGAYVFGINLVLICSFAFISIPRFYYFLLSAIIFLSYLSLALYIELHINHPIMFNSFIGNTACMVLVLYMIQYNIHKFQSSEYKFKSELARMLNSREIDVERLGVELAQTKISEEKTKYEYQRMDEFYKVARQVAHDIKSPLLALNMAAKRSVNNSEQNNLITHASHRIQSIAESLITSFVADNRIKKANLRSDVMAIFKMIINEKRLKCGPQNQIDFTLAEPSASSQSYFCPNELARILSNLLENAIEAFDQNQADKLICVTVANSSSSSKSNSDHAELIRITIKDNGKGIPPEILSQIGQYGFTYGKENGAGIGLAHAFKTIESYGGTLQIASELNKGTTITISLKAAI